MTTTITTSKGYAHYMRLGSTLLTHLNQVLRTAVFTCFTFITVAGTAFAASVHTSTPTQTSEQAATASSAVYVLKPGAGNLDYFNYFSEHEKFDVQAFHIQSFAQLQAQILEGESALQQGSAQGVQGTDAIRFTLQSEQGEVTVMIQHADGALNANHFVFANAAKLNNVAGSP